MYECPDNCGSNSFEQIITMAETVTVDEAGDPRDIRQHNWNDVERVICEGCGAEVMAETVKGSRTFIVHPDGTGEIYNLQRVEESDLPEYFRQFMFPEDDSWRDVAARWVFYDATHLSEDQLNEVVETHNEDCERILERGDFIGFSPFIRNSLRQDTAEGGA